MGLYIAAKLGLRTLILVHKTFLLDQWRERVLTFLPGASIGTIRQAACETECDIVIGMLQTIAGRDYEKQKTFGVFGFVIIDEAHHIAAPVFNSALEKCTARRMLGLSATPERPDGLSCLLHARLGGVIYRLHRQSKDANSAVSVLFLYTQHKVIPKRQANGNLCLPHIISSMCSDDSRNELIARVLIDAFHRGRKSIVLSDRIAHLQLIDARVRNLESRVVIGYYIGKTRPAERKLSTEANVILTSYSMAKEGLDIATLDTLLLATPKTDVEQCVGRVQRPHAQKKPVVVIDICDDGNIAAAMQRKRRAHYSDKSYHLYECQVPEHAYTRL
eukprot:6202931-Pleurochrysis_carterae.AAC.1